jgi:23S rRNA U2552 (ribose-2'-O)-methylase RlmE/FtsJ
MDVEVPWELNQCIPFQGTLPKLIYIQEGWKESEHTNIITSKNKISHIESHEEWELRKKITNPYEAIFSGTNDSTFPSLAKVHPLSRSYFKMIEMLQVVEFWKTVSRGVKFRSAHICEGPGGFLQCIVEALKEKKIPIEALYAMTLRPTKSHIPGWRRSIQFLRKHSQIQLEYGVDDTGNILIPENQNLFCKRAADSQIFTADGGFDFSVDYGNQEQMAFPLLLASFTMGLGCIAKGGSMIIKLFDIYSRATQDLFLGTARLFKKFTIYKPATSRPCNSERYFIAIDYIGSRDPQSLAWIQHLKDAQAKHAQSPLTRLIEGEWPPQILEAIQEQIEWQEKQQIQIIEETLQFDMSKLEEKVTTNIHMSKKWCDAFGVPSS